MALAGTDAEGVAANFACGSYVKFLLSVDAGGMIKAICIRSNGCGYMLAAANVLADHVADRDLMDLHGLQSDELRSLVNEVLGVLPANRADCVLSSIEALRSAFLDLRSRRIEEFRGEEALICTCFGVTQERIEILMDRRPVATVEEVTRACNAGGGCGSCRMLIQELLDQHALAQAKRA